MYILCIYYIIYIYILYIYIYIGICNFRMIFFLFGDDTEPTFWETNLPLVVVLLQLCWFRKGSGTIYDGLLNTRFAQNGTNQVPAVRGGVSIPSFSPARMLRCTFIPMASCDPKKQRLGAPRRPRVLRCKGNGRHLQGEPTKEPCFAGTHFFWLPSHLSSLNYMVAKSNRKANRSDMLVILEWLFLKPLRYDGKEPF